MMPPKDQASGRLRAAASAFGVAAIGTILFSTVLTFAQDAWPPVGRILERLAGHHWTAHGLLDLIVFYGFGFLLWRGGAQRDGVRLAVAMAVAAIVGGGGLVLWFLLV